MSQQQSSKRYSFTLKESDSRSLDLIADLEMRPRSQVITRLIRDEIERLSDPELNDDLDVRDEEGFENA